MNNDTVEAPRTSKAHWQCETFNSHPPSNSDSRYQCFFDRWLPKRDDWTVIEIGACPGTNLIALAKSHGYHPVALDYLPAVRDLPNAAMQLGVDSLEAIEHDFFKLETSRKYNVVMSYGFVEHFNNFRDVIQRHWKLVDDKGFMIIGVPIAGPLQMGLRRIVLTPERLKWILHAHNLEIMNVQLLKTVCNELQDARIVMCSHIRNMETWISPKDSFVRKNRRWIVWCWRAFNLLPNWLNISCRLLSPYGMIIVQRS